MPAVRIALGLALLLFGTAAAQAQQERIVDFVSDVALDADSGLDVIETIRFEVTGARIRHGINRDFPTDYTDRWGLRSTTGFRLEDVRLDGDAVPTQLSRLSNGVRIRIGDPDRLVPPGPHTYTIRYLTWWQIHFGRDGDSLDWNVTGNGWEWPIDRAELHLRGSGALVWNHVDFWTGTRGSRAADAQLVWSGPGVLDVATTAPLARHAGLTVAAGFPKGVIRAPSAAQQAVHWASDNLPLLASVLGLVCVGWYVGWLFLYGAARPRSVIVPQFAPPPGFSPAMVGYLEDKRLSDRDFGAGIVGLAVARHLKLIHTDGTYRLIRQAGGQPVTDLETRFEGALFGLGDELSISEIGRNRIVRARAALENLLRRAAMPALLCREPRNVRPAVTIAVAAIASTVAALVLGLGGLGGAIAFLIGVAVLGSLLLALAATPAGRGRWIPFVVGVAFLAVGLAAAYANGLWLLIVAASVAATAALAAASFRRLTVPTAEGWKCRDEIEGLKLFLGVAEADRLRVLNPPDFTPALYEKLLPYAIALGVEMVWSRRFAAALAASQIDYQPDWYDGSHPWNRSDTAEFSSDLGGGLSTAIAAAATPPSSNDGFSGGGDGGSGGGGSGGGGGGGGGSGW